MALMGFAIDNRLCIGCHACTVACKAEHSVPIGVNRTWVKYVEKGTFPHASRSFSVQRCNHCDDAPCVEICPVTSLFARPDGIVDFDPQRCIGCKACMQACPYDAIYLDPNTLTAAKCNYCTHRVDTGYEPACVIVCPVEAILSGDLDDPASPISRLERHQKVQYPRPEKATNPKLFYVGGETAALDPTAAPPEENYLWSGQAIAPGALEAARREAEGESRAAAGPRRTYDANEKPAPWGKLVSAYITTKAISAGTVMVSLILYLFGDNATVLPAVPGIISLLFLVVTGALLIADLKQPKRFMYILLRPQWKSWLVRGAYVILAFSPLLAAALFVSGFGAPPGAQLAIGGLAGLMAVPTAAYTALLLAQAKGRDYWQNPLLMVTMLFDALVAGTAVVSLIGAAPLRWGWDGGLLCDWARYGMAACAATQAALLACEFLPAHATRGAADAARIITRGVYRRHFWWGVVTAGVALPFVVSLATNQVVLPAAALLAGIAMKNHVLVQAPQRVPLR
ncbi:MAG: 4Fe-4S ferredoxin [Phycisphaerales bacterium]|nr:MAG: 4Fe-4S ferredoxin [Phycisphaerales bacterium]